jgi:uncharacterized repeat protein (TIGR03803 family)
MHWDGSGYQILHAFMGHPDDGEGPIGPLVEWDGRLFGVTYSGGENNAGILFAIRPDGTDYQILHSFSYFSSDPGYPTGGLAINNGTLIGTTSNGGTAWNGTIYAINPDGSGFQIVHSFTETPDDGYWVGGPLIGVSGELFGMTSGGGVYGHGTIFKLNSDGSAYQILHSFEGADGDGSYPVGSLLYSAGCLYGMTNMGGPADKGTIFKINPDGSGYQVLRALAGGPGDGEWPDGTLMETAGIFYGVTNGGGPDEGGSLFQINPDGGGFAIIRYFSWSTNDGFGAADSLLFINNYLVGTTRYGGVGGGAIFSFRIRPLIAGRVTQDGTGLAGATMSGLPGDPVTDDEGRYEAMVPIGWSGTVTPVLAGYAFTQHFLAYVNIVSDQLGQDFIASISSAPPPVQATGVDAAKFSKNPDGDTLQVTYDAVTCSAQKAILLYGSLGTWNTYSGCADNDLGNMGQDGAVNSSDLENVWFNIVWTNGPIAGHPGFGFNGMVDEPRPWTVGTLCGMTEDDHGHAACP